MSKVEVKDVVKRFQTRGGEVLAVDGVSMVAESGSMTSVVGPSGSGKTTLLYMIGSLEVPDRGLIEVGERDIFTSGLDLVSYRREQVGFIFQFFNLVNTFNALENVMLPMALAGISKQQQRQRAEDLLNKVGIGPDRWQHRPTRLSGGEQQRVAIARALGNDPNIILADEPTGNLDSEIGATIFEILRGLALNGKCVIVVTHDEDAASSSDTIIHLKDGRMVD